MSARAVSLGRWSGVRLSAILGHTVVLAVVLAIALVGGCAPASDAVKPCVGQDLGALCAPGWNPVLSSAANGTCDGNASYNADNGSSSGMVTCATNGQCSIQCVRGDMCPCGIASVSRTQLVCRTDCPAGCPDGTCESNETAASCPADCAPPASGPSVGIDGGVSSSSSGGAGATGAGAAAVVAEGGTAVVYSNDFETSAPSGTWQVDSSRAHTGTNSAHAPSLSAAGVASTTLDCGGQTHSEMSFWYLGDPVGGEQLNFYVDDVLYQTYGSTYSSWGAGGFNWTQVMLVVPTGTHTYRWDEVAPSGGAPGYFIDTISCSLTKSVANTSGQWDFEEGFVPPELTGTFEIDNARAQAGSFSAHPSLMGASGATLNFSCGGKSHSSLTFYYMGYPSAGENLVFYEDGNVYQTYGSTYSSWGAGGYNWTKVSIIVSSGMHTYQWIETPGEGGPPASAYSIDTISCQ